MTENIEKPKKSLGKKMKELRASQLLEHFTSYKEYVDLNLSKIVIDGDYSIHLLNNSGKKILSLEKNEPYISEFKFPPNGNCYGSIAVKFTNNELNKLIKKESLTYTKIEISTSELADKFSQRYFSDFSKIIIKCNDDGKTFDFIFFDQNDNAFSPTISGKKIEENIMEFSSAALNNIVFDVSFTDQELNELKNKEKLVYNK